MDILCVTFNTLFHKKRRSSGVLEGGGATINTFSYLRKLAHFLVIFGSSRGDGWVICRASRSLQLYLFLSLCCLA